MKTRLGLLCCAVLLLDCSSSKPAEKPAKDNAAQKKAPDPNGADLAFERYTLPNGLTVILHQDTRVPTVAVNVWYHVGAMHEPPRRSGFAHLFEHLMFQDSRHVGDDDHFRLLEQAGASDVNGTTSNDRTNYLETVPKEELPLALWLESDRMGFLLDTLDERKLNNQREVVKNERRQSFEGEPYGMGYLALYEALFPEGHPYRFTPIGKVEDLDAAKVEDVRSFFNTYYTPANATLTLAGNFETAPTKELIAKAFGGIRMGVKPPEPKITTPDLTSEKRTKVDEKVARLPKVTLAWLTPPFLTQQDIELDILSTLLADGKSSRLYRALVEKQLAVSVGAHEESMTLRSIFTVDATVAPGHTVEEVEAALDAVLLDIATNGPNDAEVARARDKVELGFLQGLEAPGGMHGRAEFLQQFNAAKGDPGYLPKLLQSYREVNAAALKTVAATLLKKDARVVQHAIPVPGTNAAAAPAPTPKDPTAVAVTLPPADPWRAKPPAALPGTPPAIPTAESTVLEDGVTVITVHQPALPLVALSLVARTGASSDPAGMAGRNALATAMLGEGMEGGDAAAQSDRFADLGASLSTAAGLESSAVATLVHKRHVEAAAKLLATTVRAPTLQADAFTRLQTRMGTGLEEQLQSPMGAVMHLAPRVALGLDHPYGRSRHGSVAGLKATTLDAVKTALAEAWVAKRVALVAVGDVTHAQVVELARAALSGLPPGTPPPAAAPAVAPRKRTAVLAVERPGAPQTVVVAVRPGMAAHDPALPALDITNAVFGGIFSSRLNMNLREDKGVSYGAFSFNQPFRSTGLFAAVAPVQADAGGLALREMLSEATGMTTRPMGDDEVNLARQSYARSLPGEFVGVGLIASVFSRVFALELPMDHYATLSARYAAVTKQQAAEQASAAFKPEELQLLLVGDKVHIEKALTDAKLGPATFVDVEGAPLVVTPVKPAPAKKGKKK